MTRTGALIDALSRWIDASSANRDRDLATRSRGRIAKVAEETGEVITALIGALGHNRS
ncbi:hypothetical protein ACFU8W_26950 [Streptomyces sp. NPDC057565]|uniref:hypothetical protein n=1 Tax=Streptomyces sp. NPDC057565 TaxID=3346169 RepID=UPI0036B5F3B0